MRKREQQMALWRKLVGVISIIVLMVWMFMFSLGLFPLFPSLEFGPIGDPIVVFATPFLCIAVVGVAVGWRD
jgi:hypothetical protein